jgi:hypothetical protein
LWSGGFAGTDQAPNEQVAASPCPKPPIHEREPRGARREEARRVRGGSGKLPRLAGSCEQRPASSGKASSRSVVPLCGCASHEQLVRLAVDVRGAAASSSEYADGDVAAPGRVGVWPRPPKSRRAEPRAFQLRPRWSCGRMSAMTCGSDEEAKGLQ